MQARSATPLVCENKDGLPWDSYLGTRPPIWCFFNVEILLDFLHLDSITYIFVGSVFHMPIGTKKQCCAKSIHLRHPSSLAKEQGRISCTALVHPAVSRQAA